MCGMPASQHLGIALYGASVSSRTGHLLEIVGRGAAAAVVVATAIALLVVVVLAIVRLPPIRSGIHVLARGREVPLWLRWLAGTALHIDTFTASPGAGDEKAVAAVLEAQLGGTGVRRPLSTVDLATAPYRSSSVLDTIADTVKDLPEGQTLGMLLKLVQQLLPREDLYLRGYLLKSSERGAGLVLSLASDTGDVRSSGILWADILEPHDGKGRNKRQDILRLAIAGAAWVQFQLLEEMGHTDTAYVRTGNWRSTSLFEVAVHDEGNRSSAELRALYALALDRDPGNLPTLFNLAMLELHDGCFAQACTRLERIPTELPDGMPPPDAMLPASKALEWRDPLYYQAHYSLAVARQCQRLEEAGSDNGPPPLPPPIPQGELAELCRVAHQLGDELNRAIEQVRSQRGARLKSKSGKRREAIERMDLLRRIHGPFLVLVASRRMSAHGVQWQGGALWDDHAGQSFSWDRLSLTLEEWVGRQPQSGRALHPQTLAFGHVEGKSAEVSYHTHYNRACYATLVAQQLAKQKPLAAEPAEARREESSFEAEAHEALGCALSELENALEPGDLAEWAEKDRSLRYLGTKCEEPFHAILERGKSRS